MICSRSLDASDVTEIGRYFVASVLLQFLKIAVTLEFFQASGTRLLSTDN